MWTWLKKVFGHPAFKTLATAAVTGGVAAAHEALIEGHTSAGHVGKAFGVGAALGVSALFVPSPKPQPTAAPAPAETPS